MTSWPDQVQAASSVAGVFVAIAGFFFVSYQIRQINKDTRAGAHTNIFSHSLETIRLMFDNPKIREYLYDGKTLSDGDPNFDQVMLACEMFGDLYEHVSLQGENLPKESMECWDKAIADRYERSPVLQGYLESRRHVYAQALFDSVERGKKYLAARVAELPQAQAAPLPARNPPPNQANPTPSGRTSRESIGVAAREI
ncbi:MAG: hypothetical protein ABJC13_20945 [Acidobacteriota bacterium]